MGSPFFGDATHQERLPHIEPPRDRATGIWPAQQIKRAIANGHVVADSPILDAQIQPASLDLRLGGRAYRVRASFLPGRELTVEEKLRSLCEEEIDLRDGAVLKTSSVYLVRLQESVKLRWRVSGDANPKSSVGRLDVFCRLITDRGVEFDTVPENYIGPLWLEIAPRSFDVMVRQGSRLAQVRFRDGRQSPSNRFMQSLYDRLKVVRGGSERSDIKRGAIALSVDAVGDPVSRIIGYRAKKTTRVIDVDNIDFYEVADFWEPVRRREDSGIILNPGDFHILATKESVVIPPDYAAEMVAYDTLVGEFRVHYAGFFDPGFGYADWGAVGTKIVLEVRSHEVPFMIEDGQVVGRVVFERLSEATEKPYGGKIGSSYHQQALTLSKQFKRS